MFFRRGERVLFDGVARDIAIRERVQTEDATLTAKRNQRYLFFLPGLEAHGCTRGNVKMKPERRGAIELELVPQGNLAARMQAAGSGLGGIFTPTAFGTPLAQGKETREIDGRHYVFETPLKADFALIKAHRGDRWGNLVYRKAARNFGPVMAMAAATTIAQVAELVPLGALDPENVITPGIFVQRLVAVAHPATFSLSA